MSRATRQIVVVHLADRGMSPTEIADELGVSRETVRRDLNSTPPPVASDEAAETAPDVAADEQPVSADTIEITDTMRANLNVFEQAGQTAQEAAELCLAAVALSYRGAWKFQLYPPGMAPQIAVVQLRPYTPARRT
ncbi:helix-turn-helix domain-containing protein [Streptomyces sp. NPDC057623]|uniref:helix-turn-helix domain-containing protein n=1 Tax=Streptomyces sp. NPDC057623 TaxID=3346187 RepID=UPI0036779C8D